MERIEPFTEKGLEIFLKEYANAIPSSAVENAKRRIIESLKSGRIKLGEIKNEYDVMFEIATFYSEMILLEMLRNSFVKNRVIVAEAKSNYEQRIMDMEKDEVIEMAERLGLKMKDKEGLEIRVEDYLEYAPDSIDYSLFYKELEKGWVKINKHEAKRILQEAIKRKIEKIKINTENIEKEIFENALEEIKKEIPKLTKMIKSIDFNKIKNPPCIERIIERLKKHENLAHYERWVLAIYLIKLNVPIEEINELYKNLPDYKEKTTMYQLRHIKEKEYSMPSCEKMRGYGLCVTECGTKNPMEWVYERKRKNMDKK